MPRSKYNVHITATTNSLNNRKPKTNNNQSGVIAITMTSRQDAIICSQLWSIIPPLSNEGRKHDFYAKAYQDCEDNETATNNAFAGAQLLNFLHADLSKNNFFGRGITPDLENIIIAAQRFHTNEHIVAIRSATSGGDWIWIPWYQLNKHSQMNLSPYSQISFMPIINDRRKSNMTYWDAVIKTYVSYFYLFFA